VRLLEAGHKQEKYVLASAAVGCQYKHAGYAEAAFGSALPVRRVKWWDMPLDVGDGGCRCSVDTCRHFLLNDCVVSQRMWRSALGGILSAPNEGWSTKKERGKEELSLMEVWPAVNRQKREGTAW
jgi:hypothetical protein